MDCLVVMGDVFSCNFEWIEALRMRWHFGFLYVLLVGLITFIIYLLL